MSDGPVHGWFGLTYASYLVIPRCLLEGMPVTWQRQLVALLREAEATYDQEQIDDNYAVHLRDEHGRFKVDLLREYRRPPPLPFRKGMPR